MSGTETSSSKFQIYRGSEARDLNEVNPMAMTGLTEIIESGIARTVIAGASNGHITKTLFSMPGMSLVYAWFKSDFPLPRHSHDADCLYYIIAGTLCMGTEELGAGDGFFVGSGVPYTYTPGPEGVEVLEFRKTDCFDIRFLGSTTTYWDKIVSVIEQRNVPWEGEVPPSLLQ